MLLRVLGFLILHVGLYFISHSAFAGVTMIPEDQWWEFRRDPLKVYEHNATQTRDELGRVVTGSTNRDEFERFAKVYFITDTHLNQVEDGYSISDIRVVSQTADPSREIIFELLRRNTVTYSIAVRYTKAGEPDRNTSLQLTQVRILPGRLKRLCGTALVGATSVASSTSPVTTLAQ